MAKVSWIKIATDIFDDEKIRLLENMPKGDSILIIWFKLLVLAGKQNNGGVFKVGSLYYSTEMFSKVFRRSKSIVERAFGAFKDLGMIEVSDGVTAIPSWERHQNTERLKEIREYNRQAQKRSRDRRRRADVNDMSMTSQECQETDKDKEIDKDKDKKRESIERKKGRFTPPTLREVKDFCSRCGYSVDADRFYNHYAANGWLAGRVPMKDWKAAVRKWETDDRKKNTRRVTSYDVGEVSENLMRN